MNGKGARSPKCCDRGIMRGSRPGASHRPRPIHGYGGRTFGSAMTALGSSLPLARGTRQRTNEVNLIQTLEAEQIAKFLEAEEDPRIPPRRHAARRRARGRGRAHPRPELRRRVHRALEQGHGQQLHRPQDQLRRGRRARLPALFAEHRQHRGRPQAASCVARSSIICAAAPASRRASPSAATRVRPKRPRLLQRPAARGRSRGCGQ